MTDSKERATARKRAQRERQKLVGEQKERLAELKNAAAVNVGGAFAGTSISVVIRVARK